METTTEADELIAQLEDAGQRRASANRHKLAGLQQLAKAYEDIRAYAAEASRLGITKKRVAEAVGLSRQGLDNILTGKTGV
jgi:ParB-like chromosome segregation protein Spo0J